MPNSSLFNTALKIALPENKPAIRRFSLAKNKNITTRGVLWLGQTCNLHCSFCYFYDKIHTASDIEHDFMGIDKAKKICKTLVNTYGNTSIDIQGGEPTIYKHIFDLIKYCNSIGLKPTLISNGLTLSNKKNCLKYKEAGINDFLLSMHGFGHFHDTLVGVSGAHKKQMQAINNLINLEIPFRLNCVLTKPVVSQITDIAEFAVKVNSCAVNFITFNPFEDQSKKGLRNSKNVPKYSDLSYPLNKALDILEKADIEANVRYLPLCILDERHRKSGYNFQQLPYDPHEWDYASWAWTGLQPQRTKTGGVSPPLNPFHSNWLVYLKKPLKIILSIPLIKLLLFTGYRKFFKRRKYQENSEDLYNKLAKIHSEKHCSYVYGKSCDSCCAKGICDGFHEDYAVFFGCDEAKSIVGKRISNPLHFIKDQKKIII